MPSAEACLLSTPLQAGADGLDTVAQPALGALDPSLWVSEKGLLGLHFATHSCDALVREKERERLRDTETRMAYRLWSS